MEHKLVQIVDGAAAASPADINLRSVRKLYGGNERAWHVATGAAIGALAATIIVVCLYVFWLVPRDIFGLRRSAPSPCPILRPVGDLTGKWASDTRTYYMHHDISSGRIAITPPDKSDDTAAHISGNVISYRDMYGVVLDGGAVVKWTDGRTFGRVRAVE